MAERTATDRVTSTAPESLVTLRRGLALLETLAAAPSSRGLDHATLARRAGFRRSTLYRYIACLNEAGFLEEVGTSGRYRLGPRLLYLVATMHQREFGDLARDSVRELLGICGETAHATVYDHPYSVTILITETDAPFGPRVALGSRRPLHTSASGKIFLSHADPRRLEAYLARPLEAWTAATITSPAELSRCLSCVRRQGWALDQGESYDGICGVAAPVFDFAGDVVGALALTVAADRLADSRVRQLVAPLVQKSAELSERLGRPPAGAFGVGTEASVDD